MNLFNVGAITAGLVAFLLIPLCACCLSAGRFNVASVSLAIVSLILPVTSVSVSSTILHFIVSSDGSRGSIISCNLVIVNLDYTVITLLLPMLGLSMFNKLNGCSKCFLLVCISATLVACTNGMTHKLGRVGVVPVYTSVSALVANVDTCLLVIQRKVNVRKCFVSIDTNPLINATVCAVINGRCGCCSLHSLSNGIPLVGGVLMCTLPLIPGALF